jgi:hypothetical protein
MRCYYGDRCVSAGSDSQDTAVGGVASLPQRELSTRPWPQLLDCATARRLSLRSLGWRDRGVGRRLWLDDVDGRE